MGTNPLPGYGPVNSVNRPVRTRMRGGVGAGGENPRLPDYVLRKDRKSYSALSGLFGDWDFLGEVT